MAKTKIDFKTFWEAYGVKRNRQKAMEAWERLSDRDRRAALAGIGPYREACRRTGSGIAMMYPQGYLTNRRWEDELEGTGGHAESGTKKELPPKPCAAQPPTPPDALADMEDW